MSIIRVVSIQRGCVYDGPGIRTTVFLKGCTLHCPWCCNPEAISLESDFFFYEDKCLKNKGINSEICVHCNRYGGVKSILLCPFNYTEPTSKKYSLDVLSNELLKDKDLYANSFGGVTFSGGEPLLWIHELVPALERLKIRNIDIAFETTLQISKDNIEKSLAYAKLMIIDLKLQPEMFLESENYIRSMKLHLDKIKSKKIDVIYRLVFVNSVYTNYKLVINRLQYLNVNSIELLKCHNLAHKKYQYLGITNIDYTADENKLSQFINLMQKSGINVNPLSI